MIAQNQQWIKQGYFVDAKDKNGDWQAGLILTINKSMIKIRFDGWSAKNDEVYPLNTQKLKPFRSITHGYTGPLKGPPIRQHWKFSLSQHQQRLTRFEQFTNSISQKSAFEINQYLRGEHYFYINHLLTLIFNTLQEFSSAYEYFKTNIAFLTKYMNEFVERETTVWFSHHASTGWDVNVDTKVAYSEAYYELFETINMISCGKNSLFVRGCEKFIKQFVIKENQSLQFSPQQQDTTYQLLITKQITRTQFLTTFQKLITKLFDQTFAGVKTIPLQFIHSCILVLSTLQRLYFGKEIKKRMYLNLLYVVKQHLGAIQLSDAKTNQRLIEDILAWMRVLAHRLGMPEKEDICRWVQVNRLGLWAMMIQCDILQKKLRGLTKIRQFYELIVSKLSNPLQSSTILMTRTDFLAWVTSCNLIKLIFQLNEHTEVIKKGCDMFLLFYSSKYKLITINQLAYIWQTCFSKHEAIKKVVFQFWLQLSEHVSEQKDQAKFIGVLVTNRDKIDERQDWEMQGMLSLLKSIKCSQNIRQFSQLVTMIYHKTMSNPKYINQLAKRLSCLQRDSQILKTTIDDCLQGIRQKNQHVFHLKLLSRIFAQLKIDKMYIPQNLIPILIDQLRLFLTQQQNEKLIHSIFHIFNQIMSIRVDNDSSNSTTTRITLEYFEVLWEMFSKVQNYQTRRIFYSWIVHRSFNSMYNFSVYSINQKFSPEFRKQIFFKFLCYNTKFNLSKIDTSEFIVFREFFIFVNVKLGHIEARTVELDDAASVQKKIFRVRSNGLKGMEHLWEIFTQCPENDELINSVCAFIRDLYMRTSQNMLQQEKSSRINQLMERLRELITSQQMPLQNTSHNISQQQLSTRRIRRALILTSKLLSDIKQRIQIPKDFERLQKTEKVTITVYVSMNESQQIEIYTQEPFVTIKQRIGRMFGLEKQEFTLLNEKVEVERERYQLPYYLQEFEDNYFRLVRVQNDAGNRICEFIYNWFFLQIISYLKSKQLALESYILLQMLQIHNPLKLYHNLSKQISSVLKIQQQKKKIYLHIYFLRVIEMLIVNNQLQVSEEIVDKLVSHLGIKIQNGLIVNYLDKLINILAAMRKNYLQSTTQRLEVEVEKNQIEQQPAQSLTVKQRQANMLNQHLLNNPTNCTTLLLHLLHYINHHLHTTNQPQYRLFNLALAYYTDSFTNQKSLFNTFIKDPNFKLLMKEIFVQYEGVSIRKVMEKKIQNWVKDGIQNAETEKDFAQFFINQLSYQIGQKSLKQPLTSEYTGIFHLFRVILYTLSSQAYHFITSTSLPIYNNQTLPTHLIQSFKRQHDSPKDVNYLLNGQLKVLIGLIKRQKELVDMELVEYLLYECLIYLPGVTTGIEVKCLAKDNVVLVIELLRQIMIDIRKKQQNHYSLSKQLNNSPKSTKQSKTTKTISTTPFTTTILTNLQQFNILQYWRTSKDWNIQYEQISRTKNQFVGLENPGCICYINSLLQQLFMIEQFRWAVLGVDVNKKEDFLQKSIASSNNNNADVQLTNQQLIINSPQLIPKLKLLFLHLLLSQRPSIDPLFFTSSLHTTADRPLVKIFQQMDIDEFSMILFDKIENHLHHLGHRNFVRELFGGTYSNEIISLECRHSSERQEQFLSISLDVKKHINEGFMSLVKGEILQGENAYFCEQCDRKVKAMKRLSIKRLPPHLIISLRRFQFDYEVDQKIKINKYCEFPLQLDLQNYSQQKLNQMGNINSKSSSNSMRNNQRVSQREEQLSSTSHENNNQGENNNNNSNSDIHNKKKSTNYFSYKLKGVVIHSGSADSGHYYSFIENKDGRWFEFNDEKVTPFDVKCLEDEAFGARDGEYVKIKNAYLLFYERVEKEDGKREDEKDKVNKMESQQALTSCNIIIANSAQQPQNSQSLIHPSQPTPYNLPQSILTEGNTNSIQQVIIQNKRIRLFHFLFSQQYLQFITSSVQYFLKLFGKRSDESLTELLNQMTKQLTLMNLDSAEVISSKESLLEDNQLVRAMFKYILGFTFCIQLRQKNYLITVWLFESIKLLFFQHQSTPSRILFMQQFLQSSFKQQFIDEFLIQSTKQKSRLVSNFLIETFKTYLGESSVDKAKKDRMVKKLFKLIMRNVGVANVNLPELIMMLRKVLFLGEKYSVNFMELTQWMIKAQFIDVIFENSLSNYLSKELLQKIESFTKCDFELQANLKEYPLLFGQYQEKTKTYSKQSQKQTWIFLWELWSFVRNQKQKLLRENQFLTHINLEQEFNKVFGNESLISQQSQNKQLPKEQNQNDPNRFSHSQTHVIPISPPSGALPQPSTKHEPIQVEENQGQTYTNNNNQEKTNEQIKRKYISLSYFQKQLFSLLEPIKSDKLMKLISQQKDSKAAVTLASFIAEFTRNNKAYSDLALAAIQQGLKDYESTKYRQFFLCIEKLLELQDGHAQKRRQDILRILRGVHRHNEKYFNECDYIEQWVLRFTSRFYHFRNLLRQNCSLINQMRAWVGLKRFPMAQTLKKHRLQNCQRLLFKLHGIMVSPELKDYESLIQLKSQWFQKMKTRVFTPSINYRPLCQPNQQYSKGDIVECYFDNGNNWVTGVVGGCYYGIVLIVFGQNSSGKREKMLYYDDEEKLRLKNPTNDSCDQISEDSKMEIEK